MIQGTLTKLGAFFLKKQRFFVLNPILGQFQKYSKSKSGKLKELETKRTLSIKSAKILKKDWYMDSEHFYF